MKLLSWNVNGIRAVHRKEIFLSWVKSSKADIICLQETKAHPEQLPEEIRNIHGYHSYFNAPTNGKKGYSGVAVYSKNKPLKVDYGLGSSPYDGEGRVIVAHFEEFALINCYFPKSDAYGARYEYKMPFYDAFLEKIDELQRGGKSIIFCGDVNAAHEEIDLARPKANEGSPGYLPEERAWVDEVISHGYVDTFRFLHPNKVAAYTWWDMVTHARDRNVGRRIDYFFVSQDLAPRLRKAFIESEQFGSDHCPVGIEMYK